VFKHRGPKFSTRHTVCGIISHIDAKAVPCFGHLPQDLIGRSILDLYHPADLPLLKEIYETVMKKGQTTGTPFNSKPYRLRVQNGCYITMETDWTSFVNPWTRQLEFVIGHHHVLKGPSDKNVFGPQSEFDTQSSAPSAETEEIKKDILKMFSKIMTRPLDRAKQQVTKRCKAMASFIETLMNEATCPNLKLDLPAESEITISERESVVLCEISPHHDFYDCKSSTGTPPSYNQLNYYENLQRFFASRPVTATLNDSMRDRPGTSDCHDSDDRNCISPVSVDNNGDSTGSGSGENYSSGSNMRMESVTSQSLTDMSTNSFKTPKLTKDLISRHNDEMEKVMYKKHREARMHRGADKYNRRGLDKTGHDQHNVHGVKRGISHSWENKEVNKTTKQHYYSEVHNENSSPLPKTQAPPTTTSRVPPTTRLMANLWPPFAASLPSNQKSSPNTPTTTLYYITSPQPPSSLESPSQTQLQYIPNGIMAHYPMYGGQQIVYPSPTLMFHTMSYQTKATTHLSPGYSEEPNASTYEVSHEGADY
jgi:period circadian protein 2